MILFAALPVGAARSVTLSIASKYLIMKLIMVVFPVPGPPVITATPEVSAFTTALNCCCSSLIPVSSSISFMVFVISSISDSGISFRSMSILAFEVSV